MRKNWFVALTMIGCLIAAHAEYAEDALDRFLDGIASEDVLPEQDYEPTTPIADYPGIVRCLGVTNDASFIRLIEDKVINLANEKSTVTNADARLRLSAAMLLLHDYSLTNSLPVFMAVVTNTTSESVVEEAAVNIGVGCGPSVELVRFLRADDCARMQDGLLAKAYAGVFRGLNCGNGDEVATNRTISIALRCLGDGRLWFPADVELTYIWGPYSVSSNRYLAALSVRDREHNASLVNYLNRVIAELEALPPGTMQLLPTNHLGTAWSEE